MPRPLALYYSMLRYQQPNRQLLDTHFNVVELADPSHDTDEVLAICEACFAPLGFRYDAAKMDRCPQLRVIVTNTTGVPHIEMDAAAARGIAVISLQNEQDFLATITPTAEHAMGLLLALMRRTPWAHGAVLDGAWNRRLFGAPAMLSRLRLGIVGYGRLGQMMGRYGAAFGMQVRFFDTADLKPELPAEKVEGLDDLFRWADVLSLHIPANDQTYKIIGKRLLSLCRPGAVVVNTARGEVLDEDALLALLESGHLGGAALDVLDGEFDPGFACHEHPLVRYARNHDNLLLTPHIGGSTLDAWAETERRVIDRLIAAFKKAVDA